MDKLIVSILSLTSIVPMVHQIQTESEQGQARKVSQGSNLRGHSIGYSCNSLKTKMRMVRILTMMLNAELENVKWITLKLSNLSSEIFGCRDKKVHVLRQLNVIDLF